MAAALLLALAIAAASTEIPVSPPLAGWARGGGAAARADGIVIEGRMPGRAGPQADAVQLSPSAVGVAAPVVSERTHQVQAGETLSGIAERYGVTTATLITRNGLADPDRLQIGQTLAIDGAWGARLRLPDDGALNRLQLWPWPPAQGQTLIVWLEARQPVSFSVSLNDQTYPVADSGSFGWTMIPIGPLAAPGPRTLEIRAGETAMTIPIEVVEGEFPSYNVPAAVSGPILSQTTKVSDEAERVTALFATVSTEPWGPRSRFSPPLEGDPPHSDPFGSRRTYGGIANVSAHAGEDFSAVPGTTVLAPAAGVVLLAEPLLVRGNAVILDHGQGVVSGYWHMSELKVADGDHVEAGQQLGLVGSTGLSTGAHLHWELHIRGVAVDPMQWVDP